MRSDREGRGREAEVRRVIEREGGRSEESDREGGREK